MPDARAETPLDNSTVWTARAVKQLAASDFPQSIRVLPQASSMNFLNIMRKDTTLLSGSNGHGLPNSPKSWPEGLINTVLQVGIVNDERSPLHRLPCYAYIHGNLLTSLMVYRRPNVCIDVRSDHALLQKISWDFPFSTIISKMPWRDGRYQVKALMLWYLVTSGHLSMFPYRSSFRRDFSAAVRCVAQASEGLRSSSSSITKLQYALSATPIRGTESLNAKASETGGCSTPDSVGDMGTPNRVRTSKSASDRIQELLKEMDDEIQHLRVENERLRKNVEVRDRDSVQLQASLAIAQEKLKWEEGREFERRTRIIDLEDKLKTAMS